MKLFRTKLFKSCLPFILVLSIIIAPLAIAAIGDTIAFMFLSESTNGRGIKVVATGTAGTLLHTSVAGTASIDRIILYATNTHTAAVDLTLEVGGVTDPDDLIEITGLAVKGGQIKVADVALNNGLALRAFASIANVVVIFSRVYRMGS